MLQRLTLQKRETNFVKGPNKTTATLERAKQNPRHSCKIPKLYTEQASCVTHTLKRNRYHCSKCLQFQGHQEPLHKY